MTCLEKAFEETGHIAQFLAPLEHGKEVKGIQNVENGIFCSSPLEVLSILLEQKILMSSHS